MDDAGRFAVSALRGNAAMFCVYGRSANRRGACAHALRTFYTNHVLPAGTPRATACAACAYWHFCTFAFVLITCKLW